MIIPVLGHFILYNIISILHQVQKNKLTIHRKYHQIYVHMSYRQFWISIRI